MHGYNQDNMKDILFFSPGYSRTQRILSLALVVVLALFILLPRTAQAVPSASVSPIQKKYRMARAYYQNLQCNKAWAESRKKWQTAIKAFRKVYRADPDHWLAPSCLFSMALIYHDGMYARFKNPLYLGESIANYEDVISLFPKHRLADDALYAIGKIYLEGKKDTQRAAKTFAKLIAVYPDGDMTPNGALLLKKIKGRKETIRPAKLKDSRAKINDLRHGSTKYYTRVVIEVSQQVKYKANLLEKSGTRPRRLYVNLYNCKVSPNLNPFIPIQDGLLKRVRSAQFSIDVARVVLDTETVSDYKINTLKDPFRVVVDVWGTRRKSGIGKPDVVSAPSLPQQLGLGARRIVLDPGHGGKDPGAVGPNGMYEKDIVLKVAKKTARILNSKLACDVILTRNRDVFIPLEERTAIANTSGADLFISIHVNAAPTCDVSGVETFILSLATNKDEMRTAAFENATSSRSLSDLQGILMDLMQNTKINESTKLAEYVQDDIISGLSRKYGGVKNHGIKKAPFIVLIGAQMPAILTEIGFISNPKDAKRLKSDAYLHTVAEQIASGVSRYIADLNLSRFNL